MRTFIILKLVNASKRLGDGRRVDSEMEGESTRSWKESRLRDGRRVDSESKNSDRVLNWSVVTRPASSSTVGSTSTYTARRVS